MSELNKYWKTAVFVIIAVIGFSGGWFINGWRLNKEITAIKNEHLLEAQETQRIIREKEEQYKMEIEQQAQKYQTAVTESSNDINKLKKELLNVSKKNPLPAGCRLDDERMSIIRKAVDRTNSTSSTSR